MSPVCQVVHGSVSLRYPELLKELTNAFGDAWPPMESASHARTLGFASACHPSGYLGITQWSRSRSKVDYLEATNPFTDLVLLQSYTPGAA